MAAGLVPLLVTVFDLVAGRLGPDPITALLHRTGWWALALLLVGLALTPLGRLAGRGGAVRLRRPLGLLAFAYATLHLLVYVGLDQFFALGYLVEDLLDRPFIAAGAAAWLILLALAVTSTRGWSRRLGAGWGRLHRLAYVAAGLGVLHFYGLVKADVREPLIFAGILLVLLALRLPARQGS